jgi:glycine betaine catabolism A
MTLHHHPNSPLLDHCPEGLPARAYYDPAWFAAEQKAIWARNWVYAGRKADLALASMRRLTIAGVNVILCCDPDGTITAFHNTCRHRGAELCSADQQAMGKLITCPYHAWSYSTSGRLISTAHATPTDDFVRDDYGLFPVTVQDWNGCLFLCLADTPPDLAPDLGLNALDNWPMVSLITGHRMVKDLACNWKLFWENYNECLHCPGIHPELCDLVPIYSKGVMTANEAEDWTPNTPRGSNLKPGAASWTATGKPCGPEFPYLTPDQRANGYNFVTIYPTMFIVGHVDYVRCVSLQPTGPETTRLTAEWLFPAETLAQPGFDAAEVAAFAALVMTQDGAATEMNQRGLKSPKFARARLMPQEFDIVNFHKWLEAQMTANPT